jgi:adenosylhomocysteine nucleosidase
VLTVARDEWSQGRGHAGMLRIFDRQRALANRRSVIALTGLSFEARIAGDDAIISDGLRTPAILEAAIGRHCRGIISFGVCGGLAPDLQPGQWIVASSILFKDELHAPDRRWSERLLQLLPGATYARIASVDCPLPHGEQRALFHASTGAVASDMESHFGARVAAGCGLKFAACRVVLNPTHRKLPSAALLKLKQGSPDLRAMLRSVIAEPGQVRDLVRLALDASIATACLREARVLLGPNLGFPEAEEESFAASCAESVGPAAYGNL